MKQKRKSLGNSQQGQLTGLPRQLKDNAADVHNLVTKWDKLNSTGFTAVTNVCDIKLTLIAKADSNENEPQYSVELESACNQLSEVLKQLTSVYDKLNNVASKFEKLAKLQGISPEANKPFVSWQPNDFALHGREIVDMIGRELLVKRCIVENVAHIDHWVAANDLEQHNKQCRDILMFYTSCWLHQPYINDNKQHVLIQEMLMESGHI